MYTEAREYLKQISIMRRRIAQAKDELAKLEALKYSISPIVSDSSGGGGSPTPDKMERAIVTAAAAEDRLEQEVIEYLDMLDEIKATIKSLPNQDHVDILLLKYVNGYTLIKAGRQMHYSERHAQRLHGYALKDLNESQKVQTWYTQYQIRRTAAYDMARGKRRGV